MNKLSRLRGFLKEVIIALRLPLFTQMVMFTDCGLQPNVPNMTSTAYTFQDDVTTQLTTALLWLYLDGGTGLSNHSTCVYFRKPQLVIITVPCSHCFYT